MVDNKNDIAQLYSVNKKKLYVQFKKNIFATQFHPEKSDFDGLDMFKKFLNYKNENFSNNSSKKKFKKTKKKTSFRVRWKSLIDHTFDLLKKSNLFYNIIVSTDDQKILKNVKKI